MTRNVNDLANDELTYGELDSRRDSKQRALEGQNEMIARMSDRLLSTPFETEKHHLRHDIKREKAYGLVLFEELLVLRAAVENREI